MFIPVIGKLSADPNIKEQWIANNPHVCSMPFDVHGIAVEFDGQRDVNKQKTFFRNSCCCNLINSDSGNDLKVESVQFQDVQDHIKKAKLHPRCQRCHDSEKHTGSSERTLNLMAKSWQEIQSFVNEGHLENFDFRIKFSNLCNLSCRSCSPTFSSRYAQIHDIKIPRALSVDIADNPVIWNSITDSIKDYMEKFHCLTLGLFGGESFIQPGAIRLIDYLDSQGLCSRINLDITTNFTVLPEKFLRIIPKFKSISLKTSLDSVGDNFEYVRWPAKWRDINQNLDIFFSQSQYHNINFMVQPLFNLNNIFYIDEILDFWSHWSTMHPDKKFTVSNVMMFRPWHMVIQNLPLIYRVCLGEKLSKSLKHKFFYQQNCEPLQHFLSGMVNFCQSNTIVYDQFELFLYDTARHDRVSKKTMQQGNNEFYKILTDDHKKLYHSFVNGTTKDHLPQKQIEILHSLPL
jgi:hypothetical protein